MSPDRLAGRALDAEIARVIFALPGIVDDWAWGYVPDSCDPEAADYADGTGNDLRRDDATGELYTVKGTRVLPWFTERGPVYAVLRDDGTECRKEVVPFYSTDLTAAFQVVGRLRGDTWSIVLDALPTGLWGCKFGRDSHAYAAYDETPAEAICHAALAAWAGEGR